MAQSNPVRVLCIYRVKPGSEEDFRPLLIEHWPTLNRMGLVSPQPVQCYQGESRDRSTCYIEIFYWKDEKSCGLAHGMPEVSSIWEQMEALTQQMEFIEIEPLPAA